MPRSKADKSAAENNPGDGLNEANGSPPKCWFISFDQLVVAEDADADPLVVLARVDDDLSMELALCDALLLAFWVECLYGEVEVLRCFTLSSVPFDTSGSWW